MYVVIILKIVNIIYFLCFYDFILVLEYLYFYIVMKVWYFKCIIKVGSISIIDYSFWFWWLNVKKYIYIKCWNFEYIWGIVLNMFVFKVRIGINK